MMRMLLVLAGLLATVCSAHAAPPGKAVAARDWTRIVVQTPEGGVRMGNPAAKIALIEYGSRTCPHCAHFAADGVPALKARYVATGKVSYEFRDFPVHDALDLGPILLGRCGGVARFFPLLDAMYAEQAKLMANADAVVAKVSALPSDPTGKTAAAGFADGLGYTALVVRHGVPAARARACLGDANAIAAIVARADKAQRERSVNGTPTFIVDGKHVEAGDWAALEPFLNASK